MIVIIIIIIIIIISSSSSSSSSIFLDLLKCCTDWQVEWFNVAYLLVTHTDYSVMIQETSF